MSSAANIRIVFDAKTEARVESYDRIFRRWRAFCRDFFDGQHPNLNGIPSDETDFIVRAFLEIYRGSGFAVTGEINGERQTAMAGSTIKEVVRSLGKTLWDNFKWSPFHKEGDRDKELTPNVTDLLSALESISPNKKIQKAMTPDLLRCMSHFTSSEVVNDPEDHAADLIIGGYFFAMRSCEFVKTPGQTKTVLIRLGGVKFFTKDGREIPHDHPDLLIIAHYVWILFEDQKNRDKFDTRTQERTNDIQLNPVQRWARAVQRV